jgi:hypothetical protein
VNVGGPDRPDPALEVTQALAVALQALDERADIARWMLTDHVAHGIIDSEVLNRRLQRDEDAGAVLRARFHLPPARQG